MKANLTVKRRGQNKLELYQESEAEHPLSLQESASTLPGTCPSAGLGMHWKLPDSHIAQYY